MKYSSPSYPGLLLFSALIFVFAETGAQSVQKILRPEQLLEKFKNRPAGAITGGAQAPRQAVGILDKGRMLNVVSNFGVLSNYHLFNPAIQWPGSTNEYQQYSFGVDFMVGVKGDVVESVYDQSIGLREFDWTPSGRNLFSGDVAAADGTPLLATSSDTMTWPKNTQGSHYWPGPYRVIDTLTRKQQIGAFVSDGDVYAAYNDSLNGKGAHGLEVEQLAYSFNRPYLRDMIVFDFKVKNRGAQQLDSVYLAFMVDLKPDYDNHDILKRYIKSGGELIYEYDADGIPRSPWTSVGYIGVASLPTPGSVGFTDFHFFDDENSPAEDKDFWRIISHDTAAFSATDRGKFFHGNNVRYDDVALSAALDPEGKNQGTDVTYILASGPKTLKPGDSLRITFAIVAGEDDAAIKRNMDFAVDVAKKEFLTSTPPSTPSLSAVAGDRRVTLLVDNLAEYSLDALTGKKDFQGYKLYRSSDRGVSWGSTITDAHGAVVDYVPLFQVDLKDSISGIDPVTGSYRGNNTGLKHLFVDTTVLNGLEYWYSVVAYDNGIDNNPAGILQTPRGLSPEGGNQILRIVSGPLPNDLIVTGIDTLGLLRPASGITDGTVRLEVVDPTKLVHRQYTLSFTEDDSVVVGGKVVQRNVTTYTVSDPNGTKLLSHQPTISSADDYAPVIDGFRLLVIDSQPGRKFAGWTKVLGDTSTFEWFFKQKVPAPGTRDAMVTGIADFRISIAKTNGDSILVDDAFGVTQGLKTWVPFRVHDITDSTHPVDVTQYTWLIDYEYAKMFPESTFFGPKGWDLIPGGRGYNPHNEIYPDELWFRSIPSVNPILPETSIVEIKTQNRPTGKAPSDGDQYTILTYKPFSKSVQYKFTTSAARYGSAENKDVFLGAITVVPNPLIVSTGFGSDGKQVMFNHLPKECTISVFSTAGDRIVKINHLSTTGIEFWDVKNSEGRDVAYGLYVYVVEIPNGQKHIGKFLIIR